MISKIPDPPELTDFYHPCQLEKRFGGEADTPKHFWPPYIGSDFLPNDDSSHLGLIKQEDYEQVLEDNPNIEPHPFCLKEGQQSRDFIAITDSETREPVTSDPNVSEN